MNHINTTLEKQSKWPMFLLIIGIIFIAANLRAPLTAVGSLIPFISEHLHLSHTIAGTITTVPLLAFALISPVAPKFAKQLGMEKTIFYSLLLLAVGVITRSLGGTGLLFAGTILIGCAIAFNNVLLPGFIKTSFPAKVGLMTGIYSVSMNLFGALSSGISVPLSNWNGLSWKGSLGFWSLLAIFTACIWIPQLRKQKQSKVVHHELGQTNSIWKSPLAWKVTIFMGAQSLVFYTMMTWLPEVLQDRGYSFSTAGWMLSLMQFALIPVTFFIPIIADKMANQRLLSVLTAGFYLFGMIGLLLNISALTIACIISIGIASGSAFSLSMMFFTLHTRDSIEAAELSGMAQSFGYLLASIGPVLFGGLHDLTHSWTEPFFMVCIIIVIFGIAGIGAGKKGYVHGEVSTEPMANEE